MGNIPAWAIAAAAPKLLSEYVIDPISSVYGIYKGVRDDQRAREELEETKQSNKHAADVLSNYSWAQREEDPAMFKANLREIEKDASNRSMLPADTLKVEEYKNNVLDEQEQLQEINRVMTGYQNQPKDQQVSLDRYIAQTATPKTWKAFQNFDKAYGNVAASARKAWEEQTSQSALTRSSELFGAASPLEAYKKLDEIQGQSQMSAGVNQMFRDDIRQNFSPTAEQETWGEPYIASVGGKRALVQKSSRGQIRPVIQDASTTVRITNQNPVQQSVFVDPESGKPLIFDKKSGTYKVAQVEGSGSVAPRPINPSAGEREKTAAFDTLKDQIERIRNTYNPNYVGIVSGRAGAVTQLTDPNEAAFRQVINDVKDSLLRARSGAQINEQEYARLAKLVPSFNDSEKQFAGKMRSFETTLNTLIANRQKAQRQGGVVLRGNTPTVDNKVQSPNTGKVGKYTYTVK